MKTRLRKISIDSQGYTIGEGKYYGVGLPLYRAQSEEKMTKNENSWGYAFWYEVDMEFRAANREEAKRIVLAKHPEAVFYR